MLCRLDLVSTEKITHCEMAVIWRRRNTAEIRSTEDCRAKIRSTEGCISTRPLKRGETPWKYDIQKAISTGPLKHGGTPWKYNLWKAVDIRKTINNTELVLKLRTDSSTGFMEAVNPNNQNDFLYRFS